MRYFIDLPYYLHRSLYSVFKYYLVRVKTLASKLKAARAEAADVDELIFSKDFTFDMYIVLFSFQPGI
jgi:hypothetical protein